MIEINNLTRSFGTNKAVDRLSFQVKAGEIFALLGPNGAGKTTTIKMILNMIRPDSGSITFEDSPVEPGDVEYKSRIGYVPESCALYENLRALEYLEFVGDLHHMPEDEAHTKARELLDVLDLGGSGNKLIREFSKGMKQKVLIASALMHDPSLIILDEPFSGLDANAVSVFKEFFHEEARTGKAIIFCSHVLEVVERLVDRILIVKDGQQLATGTPEEIAKRSGHATLDRAFNELTGATNIDEHARSISRIIGHGGASSNNG